MPAHRRLHPPPPSVVLTIPQPPATVASRRLHTPWSRPSRHNDQHREVLWVTPAETQKARRSAQSRAALRGIGGLHGHPSAAYWSVFCLLDGL